MYKSCRVTALLLAALIAGLTWPVAAYAQSATAIIEAVRMGDLETVRILVAGGVDVNVPQDDGARALHWAAHRNDLEAATLLIKAGANVNVANELGATPLWLAAINASTQMIERLLEAGGNPNVSLRMGETPLMTAARSGNLQTVEQLLEHGANVNAAEQERGQTALMWAVAQQHTDVTRLLIENGADLHARTKVHYQLENTAGNTNETGNFEMAHGGSTPLLFAVRNGDVKTARVLVDAGADVDDTSASGTSALIIAAHSGHGPLGIYLLEQGAQVNAAEAGYTALHAAVLRSEIELVKSLLEHGANPNAVVERGTPGRRFSADYSIRAQMIGTNALWLAAKYGELEILRTLVEHGTSPFVVPESGRFQGMSALQAAMGMPGGTTLEDRRSRIGNSPMDPADEEQLTLELARIVLDLGVDVNAADVRGNTALHHAVLKNFESVVEFLVAHGAEVNAANNGDQTPLALAQSMQTIPSTNGLRSTRPEMAELLRRLGGNIGQVTPFR